jgi:LuxR family maltose regulon positive regulatory protein
VARATPWLIGRSDLLAALDRAAARKVTVISASAGSGKTSLLRAWAGGPGQPRRLAVQVQRDQQDAQQFWLALLDTVRQASFTTGRAGLATATPDFNAPAMVDRVLSELTEARGGITLVIDDLHELTSPEAPAQLTRLLTRLPPTAHAILTTRHDLRLGLHQLRLAGELAEIRAADLRFTEGETRELLAASGIALSEAGVALLYQRTEGWAAGLRLAAISLAGHPDPERGAPGSCGCWWRPAGRASPLGRTRQSPESGNGLSPSQRRAWTRSGQRMPTERCHSRLVYLSRPVLRAH